MLTIAHQSGTENKAEANFTLPLHMMNGYQSCHYNTISHAKCF